jgi:copper resistance protein C
MKWVRLLMGAALVGLLCSLDIGPALAHAHLKKSIPAAGATVDAVSEIRLQFDEAIEPRLSRVAVATLGGLKLPPEIVSDPNDRMTLIVKFSQPLQPGSYKVDWRIVSADTHKIKGSFTFRVQP